MKRKPDFPNFPPTAGVSEEDCLLTGHDVARLLGVSPDTVVDWRCRYPERGPDFIRVGAGRIRYSLGAVRKYLNERTVRGQGAKGRQ
jgi:hypothetical protein